MGNSQGKPMDPNVLALNHFRLLRVVGKGAFGKVRIVQHRITEKSYALKYIRKEDVVRTESVRNIIRERRMLQYLNHPLLCNLRYSFQDLEYLYLVVDLMQGGDLRFHISRKSFTEEAVRFWVAEIACGLKYLHSKGIVHRDIKPDNILLDADGHVHIADFNVATEIPSGKSLSSRSGTYAYLAPEVLQGKDYRFEVDWWSLGVLFYECIFNKRPFDENTVDDLVEAIVNTDPPFPLTTPPVSIPCLHAISSLLEKDVTKRTGASGFDKFIQQDFFNGLDFQKLYRMEGEPVFVPSSEKGNFDASYDLEELLLEDVPLEVRTKRQKPREVLKDDATEEEIRTEELYKLLEAKFEIFDYTLSSSTAQARLVGISEGEAPSPACPPGTVRAGPELKPFPKGVVHHKSQDHLRGNGIEGVDAAEHGNVAHPPPSFSRPLPRHVSANILPPGSPHSSPGPASSWPPPVSSISTSEFDTNSPNSKQPTKESSSSVLGFWARKKQSKQVERGVLPKERVRR